MSEGPIPIQIYGTHVQFNYEKGLRTEQVYLATRRDGVVRLVTEIETGWAYEVEDTTLYALGGLSKIERAIATPEGTEFRGWQNTRQYRLTSQEIHDIVDGKVFTVDTSFEGGSRRQARR